MRILIASDKYKGSLTATQVAQTIQRGLKDLTSSLECDLCPIADGGEGTTEAVITALGGESVSVETLDALGRPLTAHYGWVSTSREAILEMSAASGLALVKDQPLKPDLASTYGTGLMLKDAISRGAERIVIGIGGSATNDGGLGLAAALGYQFLDEAGQPLQPFMAEIRRLQKILPPAGIVSWPKLLVACDVDNPLLGEKGATRIYGPQKGVQDIATFEAGLTHLANIAERDLGCDHRAVPGAGAAGGLGWGLMTFCGGSLTSGFDLVASQIGLETRVAAADLIITGEGRLDAQTLHGKGPVGIAQMARRLGKKVIAFAGAVEDCPALSASFDLTHAVKPADMPLSEAIARAEELLEAAVIRRLPDIRVLLGLA